MTTSAGGRRRAQADAPAAAEWVAVPGWPGYEINPRCGAVRSLDRIVVERNTGKHRRLTGVELVQVPDVRGHPQVTLSHRGRRKAFRVENLVAAARSRCRVDELPDRADDERTPAP
ncbi:hypothetical protein ABQF26_03725 [Mycolicibacterium elephantis]